MDKPNIIIDSYIPYIKGVLDELANVRYLSYNDITNDTIKDSHALIIRTRTKCNEKLLQNTKVKFIASATIGYDHIDAEYCKANNIVWTNAPGSNALSVVQYIASALSFLSHKNGFNLENKTIGIVGLGAVGLKVAELCKEFGMKVLLNDPPRKRVENSPHFVELKEICRQADIISFHTPLNVSGIDATFHLADKEFFDSLQKKPVIINAARGEIIDTEALIRAYETGKISDMILDCWENEPAINLKLLNLCSLASPHIAGYSADGKANAASFSIQAVSRFFSLGMDKWKVSSLPSPYYIDFSNVKSLEDFFLKTYDIERDSKKLKSSPETFEQQRSDYPYRREPKAYLNQMQEKFREEFIKNFPVFAS